MKRSAEQHQERAGGVIGDHRHERYEAVTEQRPPSRAIAKPRPRGPGLEAALHSVHHLDAVPHVQHPADAGQEHQEQCADRDLAPRQRRLHGEAERGADRERLVQIDARRHRATGLTEGTTRTRSSYHLIASRASEEAVAALRRNRGRALHPPPTRDEEELEGQRRCGGGQAGRLLARDERLPVTLRSGTYEALQTNAKGKDIELGLVRCA